MAKDNLDEAIDQLKVQVSTSVILWICVSLPLPLPLPPSSFLSLPLSPSLPLSLPLPSSLSLSLSLTHTHYVSTGLPSTVPVLSLSASPSLYLSLHAIEPFRPRSRQGSRRTWSSTGTASSSTQTHRSTLIPTPYTLHPTPYILHPTPYTPNPQLAQLPHQLNHAGRWRGLQSLQPQKVGERRVDEQPARQERRIKVCKLEGVVKHSACVSSVKP